jgi:hypothetical protein
MALEQAKLGDLPLKDFTLMTFVGEKITLSQLIGK